MEQAKISKEDFEKHPLVIQFLKYLINEHYREVPDWVIRDKFEKSMISRLSYSLYERLTNPYYKEENDKYEFNTCADFNCGLQLALYSGWYDPGAGSNFDQFCDPNEDIEIPYEIVDLVRDVYEEDEDNEKKDPNKL